MGTAGNKMKSLNYMFFYESPVDLNIAHDFAI